MKRRQKEINIFSMSALDLFASALGAFILIAVVLFPFFPNISPEELREQLFEAQAEVATLKAKLEQCTAEKNACEADLKKIKIPDIDLVLALDITGSMTDEIEGLKNQIKQLSEVLGKLAPTVGIGIVAFGDRDYDRPTTVQNILEVTASSANLNKLQRFVNGIEAGVGQGGGDNDDPPEAVDLALQQAIGMSWRSVSERKYIVVITDNPAYPEKVSDTYRMARRFAATSGNAVSTVLAGSGASAEARDYLGELAANGKGEFVDSSGSLVGSILVAVLSK